MKKTPPDLGWLPPREEWDFRPILPAECRVACHWEYSRDIQRACELAFRDIRGIAGSENLTVNAARTQSPRRYCPANYRQPARALFPRPWLSLTKEQRATVLGTFYPVPALQVRKLGDFFNRMQWTEGAHLHALRPYLEHAFVVQPNFSLCGVEAVIKELAAWARREAKNYRPAPRAKAAELPFDALKWLAVSRLEHARRKADVPFEPAREALIEYRRKNPLIDRGGVFPIYASHGAWSKARADADRCRSRVLSRPAFLLAGLS